MTGIDLDTLAERLEKCSLSGVSRATGLPYNTLKNVREKRNPTWETLEKIKVYFADLDA